MGDVLGNKQAIAHICLVVNDIEKTLEDYVEFFGIKNPGWFWAGGSGKEGTLYRDAPTDAKAKLAFMKIDTLTIELIEPDQGKSVWREFLDKYGEGFHHLGINIEGTEEALEILTKRGEPTLQRGGNPKTGGYAYVDTREKLKLMIELLEGY